jgi:hypothetical protein
MQTINCKYLWWSCIAVPWHLSQFCHDWELRSNTVSGFAWYFWASSSLFKQSCTCLLEITTVITCFRSKSRAAAITLHCILAHRTSYSTFCYIIRHIRPLRKNRFIKIVVEIYFSDVIYCNIMDSIITVTKIIYNSGYFICWLLRSFYISWPVEALKFNNWFVVAVWKLTLILYFNSVAYLISPERLAHVSRC